MTQRGISKMAEHPHDQRVIPRQRSSYERMYIPLVKSQPPLRAWGPHLATAIGGIVLLVIVVFMLKIITTL